MVSSIPIGGSARGPGGVQVFWVLYPRVAMQILRHSKIAITMEIYTIVLRGGVPPLSISLYH